jgi:hypothetical protein
MNRLRNLITHRIIINNNNNSKFLIMAGLSSKKPLNIFEKGSSDLVSVFSSFV